MSSAEAAPDLCVIGASEAGLAACLGAVALGLSCILVDDGDPSGLIHPDLALSTLCRAARRSDGPVTAWADLSSALAHAAPDRRHARFGAMNVRLVRGTGRFIDPARLGVEDQVIRARRFFIATGGRQPSWRLADGVPAHVCLSLGDLCRMTAAPENVLVIGGGPAAVSAAQSLARLGSTVTLATETLLPGLDPELTAPLRLQLRRDGVTVANSRLHLVRPSREDGIAASLSNGAIITATCLLLAEDSRAALEALDLPCAGVAQSGDALVLDSALRTSNRRIFAMGRAAGARSSAEGITQAGHALRAAFLPVPGRLRPALVPAVTATCPEIAVVGHAPGREDDKVWRWPLAHTAGAAAREACEGQIKVVTNRRGRILWAGLVGPDVREMLPFWTLAVAQNLTLPDLAAVAMPQPSLAEAARAIAVSDLGRRLGSPWVRRALRAARWLG